MFLLTCVTSLQAQQKLNVLLLLSDDYNNSMGCYGNDVVKTPNLDKLAARGLRFDRAYCQYPLCGPSRCSFMSGLRPDNSGILTNGPDVRAKVKDVVTLPQLFKNNGYRSMRVGKIYHLGIPGAVGTAGPDDPMSWDSTFNPKGAEFATDGEEQNPPPGNGQNFRSVKGKGNGAEQHDFQAADETIRLINENKDRPFFLACGFIRPHVPEIAPKSFFDLYDVSKITLPTSGREGIPKIAFMQTKPNWDMSEEECREAKRAYYACVAFMDAQAGRVLDELERLGLREKTIVVFMSDHGYLLGEHQCWQKLMLFEEACRVPILVSYPGMKSAGQASKSLIESVDVYPTVVDLAGLKPDTTHKLDGVSLQPVLDDPKVEVKSAAFTQVSRPKTPGVRVPGRSVRTDRYRYTEWEGGKEGVELYDQQNDPEERKNLATDSASADVVKELQKILHDGPAK